MFRKIAKMLDDEYKEAVSYGYKHFSGEELDRYLRIVEELDQKDSFFYVAKRIFRLVWKRIKNKL